MSTGGRGARAPIALSAFTAKRRVTDLAPHCRVGLVYLTWLQGWHRHQWTP